MCFLCPSIPQLTLASEQDIENIIRRIALDMHRGKLTPDTIDRQLLNILASELWKGVELGYDVPTDGASLDQWKWFNKAQESVYLFSGAKTFAELSEFSALLSDAEGNLRPYSEFLKDTLAVHKTYNKAYLEAEYNHAVATAQMSSNWNDYQENIDVAPFLKYITAGDDFVRPEHAAMDGVIKHKDDPFWDTWYPPNGWNCRCDVSEELDDENSADGNGSEILPPELFQTNVGKTGVVFPAKHPYLQDADRQGMMDKITKAGYTVPNRNAFNIPVKTKNGIVKVSSIAYKQDLLYNIQMADKVIPTSKSLLIRPHIEGGKNPELLVDGKLGDFKKPKSWASIKNSLKAAHDQKCEICLVDATSLNFSEIDRAFGKLNVNFGGTNNSNIKELWIITGKKTITLERNKWSSAYFKQQIQ